MKNNKEHKTALPELRFPEFRDAEGWKLTPLYTIGDTYGGLTGKTAKDFGQGKPYLTYKQIFSSSRIDLTKCEYVNIENNESQNTVEVGDVLITMSSETAEEIAFASTLLEEPKNSTYLNSFCFGFRVNNKGKFRPQFLRYLFRSPEYRKSVGVLAQGATRYNISKTTFKSLDFFIPQDYKEQQKIADCFSSLDDLISAVADKIEALKEYKKGLMQRLFPTEGSTVPILRFPEFQNAGKWYKKRIKDLKLDIITGFAFKGNDISELKNGIRLMRGINITEGYIRHTDDIDRYYSGSTERLSKYFLKINDLVIGMDGSKVGKNLALITDIDSKSLLVQRVARLRSQNVSLIKFLFQQINSSRFFSYVDRINTSSGIPHISQKQIEEFMVWIPDDGLEIKKIGDLLTSIDDQILAETQKLDQLKAHKKGLMQRLFPKL